MWYAGHNFATLDIARYSWFLMFEGVVPSFESKTWEEQLSTKPDKYEVPKVVEVAPMFFLIYKKDGRKVSHDEIGRTCDIAGFVEDHESRVRVGEFGDFNSGNDGLTIYGGNGLFHSPEISLFLFRKLS